MTGSAAGDWLGVRIDRGRFVRTASVLSAPFALLVAAVTSDAIGGDGVEMLQPCKVVVFRRSDGATMTEFKYWLATEAHTHMGDLASRLATTDVETMSRDLGIDLATVQTW